MKFFNNQKRSLHINCIKFDNKYLKFLDSVKYLGYIQQHYLINKKDIIKERKKFYRQFNCIIRKLHYCNLNIK